MRPKSICKYPACGKLTDMPGYCDKHIHLQKEYKRRNNDYSKMYNWEWRRVRSAYLKENPLCKYCFDKGLIVPATVVDHIKPHKGDKDLFWDRDNYQSLCKPCHDAKTAKEDGGFGNRQRGDI